MNTLKKLTMASATTVLGLGLMGTAQAALVIDDFNFDNIPPPNNTEADTNTGGNPDTQSRAASVGGLVMNGIAGWSRDVLYARSYAGADVTTADCYFCDQGVTSYDVNTTGHSYWSWTGPATDLSGLGPIQFSYSADNDGADMIISFSSDAGVTTEGTAHLSDLASTNNLKVNQNVGLPGGDLTAINYVRWDVFSVGSAEQGMGFVDDTGLLVALPNLGATAQRLDLTLDQVQAVPEPTTLVLLGLGVAGLGWRRTRRVA